jgi:hypothetical protein
MVQCPHASRSSQKAGRGCFAKVCPGLFRKRGPHWTPRMRRRVSPRSPCLRPLQGPGSVSTDTHRSSGAARSPEVSGSLPRRSRAYLTPIGADCRRLSAQEFRIRGLDLGPPALSEPGSPSLPVAGDAARLIAFLLTEERRMDDSAAIDEGRADGPRPTEPIRTGGSPEGEATQLVLFNSP